eukprot:m.113309 g.113309  ORF g.113309 m.113309 type:complete len:376 (+) comp9263_c0_seq6:95-1222(+)
MSKQKQHNMMTVLSSGNEIAEDRNNYQPRKSSSANRNRNVVPSSSSSSSGGLQQLSGPKMAEMSDKQLNDEERALNRAIEKMQKLDARLREAIDREKEVKRSRFSKTTQGNDDEANESNDDEDDYDIGGDVAGFFTTQPPPEETTKLSKEEENNGVDVIEDLSGAEAKKASKRKKSKGKGKGKKQSSEPKVNLIERNIKLAADGLGTLAMTDDEKKRLDALMGDIDILDDQLESSISSNDGGSRAPNPFNFKDLQATLSDIDKQLHQFSRVRSTPPSKATSIVGGLDPSSSSVQSKLKGMIESENDMSKKHLLSIEDKLAQLRAPIGENESLDERTLEMLYIQSVAEDRMFASLNKSNTASGNNEEDNVSKEKEN